MPRRSWLELSWPVAGVDRSVSYQKQPPFTTPDSLNCRTEDMSEYRERGGSRPGLGLEIRTELPGPVRYLGKVSVLRATWPRNYVPLKGDQIYYSVVQPAWTSSGTYNEGLYGPNTGATLKGQDWAVGYPSRAYDNRDNAQPYSLTVFLKPPTGGFMLGTVAFHVFLASASADPRVNGVEVGITFTSTGYSCFAKEYASSVQIDSDTSGISTDDLNQPGALTILITPSSQTCQLFWRRTEKLAYIATNMAAHNSQVSVISADNSIEMTKMTSDYKWTQDETKPYRDMRRDVLIAFSEGNIYQEDSSNTLELGAADAVNSDLELQCVDREQRLFIADYGAAVNGEASGTIEEGTSFTTLADAGYDFGALGVDTDYVLQMTDSDYTQNEKQEIDFYSADGGTFRLKFRGATTVPLAWNINDAALEIALEALSTIGSSNVSVSGTYSTSFIVEFTGDLAGTDVELLGYTNDLTDSGGGVPTITVESNQAGADGTYVLGSYSISGVSGDTLTFDPGILVGLDWSGDIGNVSYQVVRAPKVYNPATKTAVIHSASLGSVPAGCRLVTLYRDRIVYAASDLLPHVWYMSRQGDPYDWDYSETDSGAAIFAQASVGGQLADPITALIAHGDECLIVGCYNSLWIVRGDPGYGGTQDQLSRKIGIVGPRAWCRTPDDMCVFLSTDGLYVVPAGCHGFPTSLSRERIPDELLSVSQEQNIVTMEYDTIHRGIHIFLTSVDGSRSNHWWFDWQAKSFWRVSLATDHEPHSLYERTAWDDAATVLIGGRDGYIRAFNRDYEIDDQENEIESYCLIGPFHCDREGYMEGLVTGVSGTLGQDSGPVDWELMVGDSAEGAFRATARESGTWSRPGLNYLVRPRARGVSAVIKVSNGGQRRWYLERIIATLRSAGQRRVR